MKISNATIIIGAIILVAIASIAVKSCIDKKRPKPVSPTTQLRDTVNKRAADTQRFIDSLQNENARLNKQKDSLKKVADKRFDLVELEKIKARAAQREYELSRKYADTANALAACDSMVSQITALSNEIDSNFLVNRQLQNSFDSLLSNTSIRAARLEFDNSFLKEKFDKVAGNCEQLEKDNDQLQRKVKKKIAIGPSGTFTYWDGKPRIVAGVSVVYALIKL